MNINLSSLNKMPIPTWRWLKINESSLNIEGDFNFKVLNTHKENLIKSVNKAKFENLQAISGLGKNAMEFIDGHTDDNYKYEIPEDATLDEPIIIKAKLEDNDFALERNEIYIGKNSKVKIILIHQSEKATTGVIGGYLKIVADENAEVEIVHLQILSPKTIFFFDVSGIVKSNSKVNVKQFVLGGEKSYLGLNLKMNEEKANVNILNHYIAQKNSLIDMNYLVELIGKKNEVEINSKGLLLHKAEKIFRGTLDFQRGCNGSIGSESEDVLLLDEDIINKSIPIILCGEDDIQGDHAASIGQMDKDQEFYLNTRGLNQCNIRQMLIDAKYDIIKSHLPMDLHTLIDEFKEEHN